MTQDFPPFFRIHKTGHIERYFEHDFVPPSHDTKTNVVSKDVIISSQVSARIYLPNSSIKSDPTKLPIIIYIHGGAFSVQSAFSSFYHNYINNMCSKSRSIVVSVEYRLAPESPLPACYDDAWQVLKWVGSHIRIGSGSDPWLAGYGDFKRVFLAGDSAGGNIAHNMVVRGNGVGLGIVGLVLIHPFFGMDGAKVDRMWRFICPDTTGLSDVRYNPGGDTGVLSGLGCERVLVCVAENDPLRKRGLSYFEKLKKSGWKGVVELFETVGEGHVFHLFDPGSENARVLMDRVVGFMGDGPCVVSRL